MGLKEQRKHDKKRKARDAKRKELRLNGLAYEGDKYHSDFWTPYYLTIESTIFNCFLESRYTITNVQVRQAIVRLIERLKKRQSITLSEADPVVTLAAGQEVEYLAYRIRQSWLFIFDKLEPISLGDLAGLHRSLLASIDRHNNHAAGGIGYLNFLQDFLTQPDPEKSALDRMIDLLRHRADD